MILEKCYQNIITLCKFVIGISHVYKVLNYNAKLNFVGNKYCKFSEN